MRFRIKTTVALLLTVAAVSAVQAFAQIPADPGPGGIKQPRADIAFGYTYLHSNAPPGGCGCFNMNGGNATAAWPLQSGRFALAGDITVAHASAISSSANGLTLSTFTAGVRYMPLLRRSSLQPFGQALMGIAHSSGTLVQGSNPGAGNGGAAFASIVGGGLNLQTSQRISIRLVEADYVLTTVDNGANNHQNNLRIAAGVVVQLNKR